MVDILFPPIAEIFLGCVTASVFFVFGPDVATAGESVFLVRPRTATENEILEKTGYPCGGVPSFGYKATFIIDPKVMEKEFVYTGGGSEYSLVRITSRELKEINNGLVFRVRK